MSESLIKVVSYIPLHVSSQNFINSLQNFIKQIGVNSISLF